ncbi:MAG: phosphoglucosamine mutase [Oscillospiraceae bacterium]
MGKYFGTDGIRGVVNEGLDASLAFKTGQAAAAVLAKKTDGKPLFTIGKDTRISGDMLEAALIAGLCSSGANVITLGVLPTPAVAYITKYRGADAGIVISASHNPYEHNGIKIFNVDGFKLSDELENQIEYYIDHPGELVPKKFDEIGNVTRKNRKLVDDYINHIISCAENEIKGLNVIIDSANGAAYRTVNDIFSSFPIELELIKDHPDGININDECGSTSPEHLSRMVVAGGYDIGIAFDGDADRCIIVDEKGNIVDGDKIMAICGVDMMAKGKLKKNTIVATVMSNLGFHEYSTSRGLNVECTAVGDRYVLERMLENGYNLGGEQSGHIIFLDDATTGDGQLAAVKFLSILSGSGKKVSELVAEIPSFPQVLKNVEIMGGNEAKVSVMANPQLETSICKWQAELGDRGRILVRPSGTEALIRVMIEAEVDEIANECAQSLYDLIKGLSR